jgi:putative ABC transport system permease protein
MIRHYLAIVWRNLIRKRTVSLINILGLSIGIASSILIFLWANDELNFDKFHNNLKYIYRVYSTERTSTGTYSQLAVQAPLGKALEEKYPEIKSSCRFIILDKLVLTNEQREFWEKRIALTDPSFFEIFTFPFVKGDSKTAMENINSIVLTQKMADKYFPDSDPIGKVISIQNYPLTVTGIIKDIPNGSSFQFDFIIPFGFLKKLWEKPNLDQNWESSRFYTYILLNKNVNVSLLEKRLMPFYKENLDWKDMTLHIQSFKEVYLNPIEEGGYNLSGSKRTVYLFSFIAIFILIIVSINFINLYTANSFNRAKEIGIKKCIGSGKLFLISQFFLETTIIVLIAFILAMAIVYIVLPIFNGFTNKEMIINMSDYRVVTGFIFILLLISILAGFYPAFYLSALKPEKVLKGNFFRRDGKFSFRKILIVFQFFITLSLLIITVVAYKQMAFIKNRDLGFSKDYTINLTINDDKNYQEFKKELLKNPVIESVTATNYFKTDDVSNTDCFWFEGQQENSQFNLSIQQVDFDYFKTFDVKIIEGRDFSRDMNTDATSAYILNKRAIEVMGINKPIGKTFNLCGAEGTIIGIIDNANFMSLKIGLDPRLYMIKRSDASFKNVLVKLNVDRSGRKANISDIIGIISNVWRNFYKETPFEYQFVDQIYDGIYKTDQRNNKVFVFFTILAIVVSCLGLSGLTLLSAQQRTKEISIRKVHGATLPDIITMLNISYIKLIAIAFLFSIPFACYTSHKLLQSFAFRTNISWWIFLLAGMTVVLIAVITVSYQSWSIAKTNPAERLKHE